VGPDGRGRPGDLRPRPGGHRLDDLRPEIHLPSIIEHARVRTSPGKSIKTNRADRARKNILSPERHVAAFDLENTLIASNVVDSYAWLASRHLPRASGPPSSPTCWPRRRSCSPSTAATGATSSAPSTVATRGPPSPAARRRLGSLPPPAPGQVLPLGYRPGAAHQALGHRTILITGALDFVVEPFRPLFDEIVCAELGVEDGKFTGRLETLPPIGEARALVLADYAESEGLRLEESMAYADSASDLPMLEAVGFPVAVNPEAKLAAIARRRGWHVETWHQSEGGSQPLLPLGPLDRRGAARRAGPVRQPGPARPDGRRRSRRDEGPGPRAQPAGFAASRVASLLGSGRGAGIGPLQLLDAVAPERPGDDWYPLRRCCRASAAPTWPHSTGARRATSRTSSASPSCPATRWSACSTRWRRLRRT